MVSENWLDEKMDTEAHKQALAMAVRQHLTTPSTSKHLGNEEPVQPACQSPRTSTALQVIRKIGADQA